MNFTVVDIVHIWADSRGEHIDSVLPSKGKIDVCCTVDLSGEAVKVCRFITVVVKQSWTFQIERNEGKYIISFFPEKVSLSNLFT